jgi:hypothetical protein
MNMKKTRQKQGKRGKRAATFLIAGFRLDVFCFTPIRSKII